MTEARNIADLLEQKEVETCDCDEVCSRWGFSTDGSCGFYCPYVPKFFKGHDKICKKTLETTNGGASGHMRPHYYDPITFKKVL